MIQLKMESNKPVNLQDSWTAKGTESGTVFEDIDLCEDEWAEYDEKVILKFLLIFRIVTDYSISAQSGEPVGISNIEVQFKKEK